MDNRKLRIFLAEDDEDDREFFSNALTKLGSDCELTMLNNGEKVIRYFSTLTLPPDFVFLDINMPMADGIECLRHIKKLYPDHTFPVIMLSTAQSEDMVRRCYAAGASAYIRKPGRFSELVDIIRYCIQDLPNGAAKVEFVLNKTWCGDY